MRKTDAVFFMDQDDAIPDGVLLSESPESWRAKAKITAAAELMDLQKVWMSSDKSNTILTPGDAVSSKVATTTRTICRDETVPDSNRRPDWYITVSSGATPGKPNNQKRYEPN